MGEPNDQSEVGEAFDEPATQPDGKLGVFLAEARKGAESGLPKSIKIRRLIGLVGAARRGGNVVEKVQTALDEFGLATDPPFTGGWIDNYVVLRLAPTAVTDGRDQTPEPVPVEAEDEGHVGLTVQSLRSAGAGIVLVERTQDLNLARSLMLKHGYSQLAVMSGPRKLIGAVSWESMAKAALRDPNFSLADATERTMPVRPTDDLIALIPRIISESFVFVLGADETIAGIVTMADLSEQFATLANPFFLLGEIERRLRLILVRAGFMAGDFDGLVPASSTRVAESPHDLTLGEIQRLLERPEHWSRLDWPLDRAEFGRALDEVREIRNDVMHFSPDPLLPEQLRALTNFLSWLRVMEPRV